MKVTNKVLSIFAVCLFVSFTIVKGSSAATINAASCSQSNVQSALSSANYGDTVIVPSGNCTWSSSVTVNGKTLIGGGDDVGGTVITMHTERIFTVTTHASYNTRVSGFRLLSTSSASGGNRVIYINEKRGGLSEKPVRIDHIYIGNGWTGSSYRHTGAITANCVYGVIDHVEFNEVGKEVMYVNCTTEDTWDQNPGPVKFGSDEFLFIEDSTWVHTHDSNSEHAIMSDGSGKYVARYNSVTGSMNFDSHGYCGSGITDSGTRATEIYKNSFNMNLSSRPNLINYRGGPGYVWGNNVKESGSLNYFLQFFEYQLHYDTSLCKAQGCPGTYPAPQQIGFDLKSGSDSNDYMSSSAFELRPVYLWDNNILQGSYGVGYINVRPGTGECGSGTGGGTQANVKIGREFYTEANGYVTVGSDASKASSCTDGHGYWASDTERLYVCSSNAWVFEYAPYHYPHPLTVSAGSPPPVPTGFTGS